MKAEFTISIFFAHIYVYIWFTLVEAERKCEVAFVLDKMYFNAHVMQTISLNKIEVRKL